MKRSNVTPPVERNPELEALIRAHGTLSVYPAHKIFLEPGDDIDHIYYILEGRTRHFMMGEDGNERVLYILNSGWFFGEARAYEEESTGLYSQADIRTKVYRIPLAEYQKLFDENKMFRDAVMHSYARKVLILCGEIENISFCSSKERLKQILCSIADTDRLYDGSWYNLKVRYTQYELSVILGIARGTVNKLMNELYDEGIIRRLNKDIQLHRESYKKMKR